MDGVSNQSVHSALDYMCDGSLCSSKPTKTEDLSLEAAQAFLTMGAGSIMAEMNMPHTNVVGSQWRLVVWRGVDQCKPSTVTATTIHTMVGKEDRLSIEESLRHLGMWVESSS